MSLKGSQLAADLSQLKLIGVVDLPTLAYIYAEMNNVVADTANDADAFAQPSSVSNQVGPIWTAVRDRLQNILGNTATALDDAGRAVLHIVDAYAATDAEAAQALDKIWIDGPPEAMLVPAELLPPGPPAPVKLR